MSEIENFNLLVDKAMAVKGQSHMRPVIAKELLHYDILFALEKEGYLDQLTFQGGTSLRLCYGAARFSEDLDFVGGRDFDSAKVMGIKSCIERYIGDRYALEVDVKEPKDIAKESAYAGIHVDKWQVRITTSPESKDLPKQRIKLEVANIPAYSREPKAVMQHYDFLPDGYDDMLIMTESLDEIMADKVVSLVSCERYVRHRDIWDLRWLKQHGAILNIDYVVSKIDDYRIDHYSEKLTRMINRLDEIVRGVAFRDEMTRFLPADVQERTMKKEKFVTFLINENKALLEEVGRAIQKA